MPETKHTILYQQFEEKLKNGTLTGKLPNVYALAAEHKVSPVTMTKVLRKLQQGGYISIQPRKGMFVTLRGENRRPTRKLLCWIRWLDSDDERSAPFKTVEEVSEANGYHLLQLGSSALEIFRNEEFLTAINVDGYLFSNATLDLKIAENLQLNKIPFVSVNQINNRPSMNLVEHDHHTGRTLLYQHLYDCGCRRIAEIIPANKVPFWTGLLQEIYNRFMRSHKIYHPEYYTGNDLSLLQINEMEKKMRTFIEQQTDKLLSLPNRPDAIIANSIPAAKILHECLSRRGLGIPEDIQIATIDMVDGPQAPENRDFTRLEVNNLERLRKAMRLLINQIENPEQPFEQISLKPKLFAGKTTAPFKQ